MRKKRHLLAAAAAGILNGLLGAGGGMVVAPLLQDSGLDPQRAHATSIAIMLPLSILSCVLYWQKGVLDPVQALPYLPLGLIGALLGAWLLPRMHTRSIRRIFGVLVIWAALRMLLQ